MYGDVHSFFVYMKQTKLAEKLTILEKEEFRLFGVYNKHTGVEVKLNVLNQLVSVVNKINILKELKE